MIKRGKRFIDFSLPLYQTKLFELQAQLKQINSSETKLIFLDEAVFTFNTFASRAWFAKGQTLQVPEKAYSIKTQALIMAISIQEGVEHYHVMPNSINNQAFQRFLEELSAKNEGRSIAIFMDNMRVHHSRLSKEQYSLLNITPIFNIPYSPQFNGIEAVFSMVKQKYKVMALRRIVMEKRYSPRELIDISITELEFVKIQRCIDNGMTLLFN